VHVRRLEVPTPVAVENQHMLIRYMHTRVGGRMGDSLTQCRAIIEGWGPGVWGLPPATESVILATFIEGLTWSHWNIRVPTAPHQLL